MAAKKKTLFVSPFDDITVVALTTSLKDYKLAWHLNESLRLGLKKYPGLQYEVGGLNEFSFYFYDAGENMNVFNLIQLHSEGLRLLKLPMAVDFLLIIRNNIDEQRLDEWINTMRQVPGLTMAFLLDIDKHKAIDPLLEMIELHEFNLLREQGPRRQPRA